MNVIQPRLLRNTDFLRLGGEVEEQFEDWIRNASPLELAGLLDASSLRLLCDAFVTVGGCEGTIWLLDSEEKHLVAVYNSGSDAEHLIGFEQPVGTGIISMVYSQQQPYCENEIGESGRHDDTLDRQMRKRTSAMIAVPFYFAFGLRGVISCVQLEGEKAPQRGFSSADTAELTRVAIIVERLINESLLSSALGLNDVG